MEYLLRLTELKKELVGSITLHVLHRDVLQGVTKKLLESNATLEVVLEVVEGSIQVSEILVSKSSVSIRILVMSV